jgi:hypothetical protein
MPFRIGASYSTPEIHGQSTHTPALGLTAQAQLLPEAMSLLPPASTTARHISDTKTQSRQRFTESFFIRTICS